MASGSINQNLESDIHIKTITLNDGEPSADITAVLNRECSPVPKGFTIVFIMKGVLAGVCLMHAANRYVNDPYGAGVYISYYAGKIKYYQCINGVWSDKT